MNYLARDARAGEDVQGLLLIFLPLTPKQLLGIHVKHAQCECVRRLQHSRHWVYFLSHQIIFWLGYIIQGFFFFSIDRKVPKLFNIHQLKFFPNCTNLFKNKHI